MDKTTEVAKSGEMKDLNAVKSMPGVTKTELDHLGEHGRMKMSQIEKNKLPENDALRALARTQGLEATRANVERVKKAGLTGKEATTALKDAHADLKESVGKENADRAIGSLFKGSVARPRKPIGEI